MAKEDIQVRFYEEKNGAIVWEGFGDFQPTHVHKQVAISFRTPRYRTLDVPDPVKVFIQLKRPSDGATSESLPFELLPLDSGRPPFWSLRRTLHKKGDYNVFSSILAADSRTLISHKNARQKPKLNGTLFEPENKIEEETQQPAKQVLETDFDGVEIVGEWKNEQTTTSDYTTEVAKRDVEESAPETNNNNEEKSLNDLLNQVAELDEIYSDTQARLLMLNDVNSVSPDEQIEQVEQTMDVEIVNDNDTYTSLQMAYKNPVDMQYDVLDVKGPLIEICPLKRESEPEKLPPYPPKRIKKASLSNQGAPFVMEIKRSTSFDNINPDLIAPVKKLPPTPSTLPNPKKSGFFSKLFSKKNKKSRTESNNSSRNSLNSDMNISQKDIFIPLHGDDLNNKSDDKSDINDNDEVLNLDLTEAEHYALYTAMAPHATQSEFDEMSCYYSPVEGGKIVPATEIKTSGNA